MENETYKYRTGFSGQNKKRTFRRDAIEILCFINQGILDDYNCPDMTYRGNVGYYNHGWQKGIAAVLKTSDRTIRNWITNGAPKSITMLMHTMIELAEARATIDGLQRQKSA